MVNTGGTSFPGHAFEQVQLTFRKAETVEEAPASRPLTPYDKAAAMLDSPEARAARLARRKATSEGDEGALLERVKLPLDLDEEGIVPGGGIKRSEDQTAFARFDAVTQPFDMSPQLERRPSPFDKATAKLDTPEAKAQRLAQRQRSRGMDFER